MAELKTKATAVSVADYLQQKANTQQAADAKELMALFAQITQEPATMWGPSIVGYGVYRYTYDSGRSGEMCITGFAIRGREFVLYLMVDDDVQQQLLSQLGKYKMGKACLYFKTVADIDMAILAQLISHSVAKVKQLYG